MRVIKLISTLFALSLMSFVWGQVELDEVYQSYYHSDYSKFNAAQMGHKYSQAFSLRYAGFSGVKRVVNNVFINAYSRSKSEKLTYGLRFNNEQEGKFIARMNTDFALNYFIFQKDDKKLSAGLSAGAYNLFFKSDGQTPGGSGWSGDISFSTFYSSKSTIAGLALNHLFFTPIQPINTEFIKSIHANLLFGKVIELGSEWQYDGTVMADIRSGQTVVDFFQELKYANTLLGISVLNFNTMAFVAGLDKVDLKVGQCDLDFVYNVKFRSFDRILSHKYELGMKFYLD